MATIQSYDELPYLSGPFPQCHPNRLGVLGALCGLTPPPVASSRVLELGCASGGNLIPMALTTPEGRFLGVDLSERQVADGQRTIEHLGLTNVELRHGDILDVDASTGVFDWIVAQGVYSWVPPQVRAHVLQILKTNLAPQGVAYVGFNTYPGWSLRGMLRQLILAEAGDGDRAACARALFETLSSELSARTDRHAIQLRELIQEFAAQPDWHLGHDLLGDWNTPFSFHTFARDLGAQGLRYLGDSNYEHLPATLLLDSPEIRRGSSEHHDLEQRRDLLSNQTHRGALVCRADAPLIDRADWSALLGTHLASSMGLRPQAFVATRDASGAVRYERPEPSAVDPALARLADAWPRSLSFAEAIDDADPTELGPELLTLYSKGRLEVTLEPPRFTTSPGERPKACPLARHLVQVQAEVTNRKHERVLLTDDLTRKTLALLDGTLDRAALASALSVDADAVEHAIATLAGKSLLVS